MKEFKKEVEYPLYVTINHNAKKVEHLPCIDFRFIDDGYELYLRLTTETIPKQLYRLYKANSDDLKLDIVAFGCVKGSQIRIDAKQVKLSSGINLDTSKSIELYFIVDDYILDIK